MVPVEPSLFDLLDDYAAAIERGEIDPTRSLAWTSPALTFCENFYAQFFQKEVGQEITGFSLSNKRIAVRARLAVRATSPAATIQLITWFEKLCDIHPNVLALSYGGGSPIGFRDFHANYLMVLLQRIRTWAEARAYRALAERAQSASTALGRALRAVGS